MCKSVYLQSKALSHCTPVERLQYKIILGIYTFTTMWAYKDLQQKKKAEVKYCMCQSAQTD